MKIVFALGLIPAPPETEKQTVWMRKSKIRSTCFSRSIAIYSKYDDAFIYSNQKIHIEFILFHVKTIIFSIALSAMFNCTFIKCRHAHIPLMIEIPIENIKFSQILFAALHIFSLAEYQIAGEKYISCEHLVNIGILYTNMCVLSIRNWKKKRFGDW